MLLEASGAHCGAGCAYEYGRPSQALTQITESLLLSCGGRPHKPRNRLARAPQQVTVGRAGAAVAQLPPGTRRPHQTKAGSPLRLTLSGFFFFLFLSFPSLSCWLITRLNRVVRREAGEAGKGSRTSRHRTTLAKASIPGQPAALHATRPPAKLWHHGGLASTTLALVAAMCFSTRNVTPWVLLYFSFLVSRRLGNLLQGAFRKRRRQSVACSRTAASRFEKVHSRRLLEGGAAGFSGVSSQGATQLR